MFEPLEALEARVLFAADAAVTGRGVPIADNDLAPSVVDDTDFGTIWHNRPYRERTFALTNSGDAALTITTAGIRSAGRNPRDFRVVLAPGPGTVIPAGGSADIIVRFDPVGTGERRAMIKIDTDQPDDPMFRFSVRGAATRVARLRVQYIGSSSPDPASIASYLVSNPGARTLHLQASIANYGSSPFPYKLTSPGSQLVRPGGSTVVTVQRGFVNKGVLTLWGNAAGTYSVRITLP